MNSFLNWKKKGLRNFLAKRAIRNLNASASRLEFYERIKKEEFDLYYNRHGEPAGIATAQGKFSWKRLGIEDHLRELEPHSFSGYNDIDYQKINQRRQRIEALRKQREHSYERGR